MSTLVDKAESVVVDVSCTDDELRVVLSDGRTVTAPLAWFPRLLDASREERADWELIGGGVGIHWETVDEDISVASLLQLNKLMDRPASFLYDASRSHRVGR
jgi:hypothetical protein